MRILRQIVQLVGLLFATLLFSGCVSSILATMAVKAPNQQRPPRAAQDESYAQRFDSVYAQAWRLSVGPPSAELAVGVIEPGNYDFRYSIELKQNEQGHRWRQPKFEWTLPERTAAPTAAVRGTVLILHGYSDAKENVMHWGLCLAQQGFRCVLVDLRGHGRSSGATIGYGAFEVRDLEQVLDDLQKRNLMGDQIGVLGVSYGASMSLLLAAQDKRVAVIVALEPFSDAAQAVVEFAHGISPGQASKISESTFAAAVTKAAQRGNFSWSTGDVLAAMDHVTAPVLFYHGAKDTWLSPENSRRLAAKAPATSRLVILPNDDHVLLSMRLGSIVPEVTEWMGSKLIQSVVPPVPPSI